MRNLAKSLSLAFLVVGCAETLNTPIRETVDPLLSKVDPLLAKVKPLFTPKEGATDDCLTDASLQIIGFAPQTQKEIERFDSDSTEIVAYEFESLSGPYAKEYLFLRYNGGCVDRAFLVGAFEQYQVSEELTSYHFDLYTNAAQSSIALGTAKPSYDSAKNIAIRYLK